MPTDRKPIRTTGSEEPVVPDRLIRELELTPAEARVLAGLTEGLSYEEIAKSLGVSYHTVHTHVKAIHVKAGVSTNGRLLALLRRLETD